MTTCGNTFDGQHHYAPRRFGSREAGNLRTELACVCGLVCPNELRAEIEAALQETEIEKERQRFPISKPGDRGYGKEPRYLKKLI